MPHAKKILLLTLALTFVLGGCSFYKRSQNQTTDNSQTDPVWVSTAPVQCFGNPWEQAWLATGSEDYEYLRDNQPELIRNYYKDQYNIEVLEIKSEKTQDTVCLACDCPRGDSLSLKVSPQDAEELKELGYE